MPESRIRRIVKLFHPAYFVAGTINATLIGVTVYGVHQRYELAALAPRSSNTVARADDILAPSPANAVDIRAAKEAVAGAAAPAAAPMAPATFAPTALVATAPLSPSDKMGQGTSEALDLAPYFNVAGIVGRNAPVARPLDAAGLSLSASELRVPIDWSGFRFEARANNAGCNVVACDGQTITLHNEPCKAVAILAMAVERNQNNQVFTLQYADGRKATLTRSIGSWRAPAEPSDDTVAKLMSECISSAGQALPRYVRLYAYRFPCEANQPVSGLILPKNRRVIVLAVATLPVEGTQNPTRQLAATSGFRR